MKKYIFLIITLLSSAVAMSQPISSGGTRPAIYSTVSKTGGAIAFNQSATYNESSPYSGAVTYDFSGAIPNTEIYFWYNGVSLPTLPSGTTIVGNSFVPGVPNKFIFFYVSNSLVYVTVLGNGNNYVNPEVNTRATNATTANSAVTALTLPWQTITLKANTTYSVRGQVCLATTGTGGVNFGFSYTTTVTPFIVARGTTTTASTTIEANYSATNGYNTLLSNPWITRVTGGGGYVAFDGTIDVGSSDAVVTLLFAPAVATQTITINKPGTRFTFTAIP